MSSTYHRMQSRMNLYRRQETGDEDVDNSDVGELTISSHYRQCAATEGEGEGCPEILWTMVSSLWRVADYLLPTIIARKTL